MSSGFANSTPNRYVEAYPTRWVTNFGDDTMRTLRLLSIGSVCLLSTTVWLGGCSSDDDGGGSGGSGGSGAGGSGGTSGGSGGSGASAGTSASGGSGGAVNGGAGGSTGGSAGATTGGTGGGSAGSGTGGSGGAANAAEAFCAKYETVCTYGGADRYADETACISAYEGYDSMRQGCVEKHLQNAVDESNPTLHCPHATGQAPCN
ncbi:MAG: hypothetical protein KC766_08220 [Myxococcales bacterium]|nr:hypothetical protein [Myxococcales bacterium]